MMGHVFLVDSRGHVRWRAHALPGPNEAENLVAAARSMLVGAGLTGEGGRGA
jgi:hypothetical protein